MAIQVSGSELKLRLQLNHSRTCISPESGAQDTGRGLLQVENLSESRRRNGVVRKTKIRMVEKIEELKPNPERGVLPSRNFCLLRDRQIRIQITGASEAVASLGERYG